MDESYQQHNESYQHSIESYQHHFAVLYDRLMEDMPYEEWQRFVREAWRKYGLTPQSVVDLGCGTGRHTVAFAQDGLHMLGIDRSEHMLAVAQERSEQAASSIQAAGGSVTLLQQDMREWSAGRAVDGVLCLCDGLNYLLTEKDVQAAIASVHDGLSEGGLFVFDVLTEFQYEKYAEHEPYTYDAEDLAYIWYSEWDQETRIMTHELTMFVQEHPHSDRFLRIQEVHRQRAYTQSELTSWLREVGFARVECFADFTWQPPTERSARVFYCAQKES